MEDILLVVVTGLMIVFAYTLGLRHSQKIAKGEEITIADPIKAITQKLENTKLDEELEKLNKIMDNIENYSGDSKGQKEVK